MRRILFAMLVAVCSAVGAKAAPGDTTWVQANNVNLDYYNNFDSAITFPTTGTSYRKVLMIFTLGKYTCATGSTWCGDWDYTVQNFVMTPTDTFELGRLITPYANASAPRTPFTWKQHYVFDVTPYASKLTGPAIMRILYSGYSGGFTADIKFAFIEGVPERNVTKVKRLWYGSFGYGGSPDINSHFPAITDTVPANTQSTELKFTVTGHGSDNTGCSEFCSKNYQVMLNGSSVATKTIWRDNCGLNELYPQSGTWVYDRGNWCPGAMVYAHHNVLPGLTANTAFNTNLVFDSYTAAGGSPSYTTEAHLIYYGGMNHTTDVSLDDIIAPTNNENYFRENTICGKPTIHVRNSGSATITSMTITYGVVGGITQSYDWTGSLASMQEADIALPESTDLNNAAGLSGTQTFSATIATVNGSADEDATNNTMSSQYVNAALWPTSFKVQMTTNNEAISGTASETSWKIYDMNNTVVAQRTDAVTSHAYVDTVTVTSGCYKLVLSDAGCNGLNWWANPTGTTSGSFLIKKLAGTIIPMAGYTTTGTFGNDFGCEFVKYFYASPWAAGVENVSGNNTNIQVYPNPAQNEITVDLSGLGQVNGTVKVIDMLGREVLVSKCNQQSTTLTVAALANGLYTVQYIDANSNNRLNARVVISK
jgi:hypothetical protein